MTEFERRTEDLRAHMQDAGVDLIAIGPTANMRYLNGFVPHPDERRYHRPRQPERRRPHRGLHRR